MMMMMMMMNLLPVSVEIELNDGRVDSGHKRQADAVRPQRQAVGHLANERQADPVNEVKVTGRQVKHERHIQRSRAT